MDRPAHAWHCPDSHHHPTGLTGPGTQVRLLRDIATFGTTRAQRGEVGLVKWSPFGPHATANGGGWDVFVIFADGRRFPSFTDHFDQNEDGEYILIEDKNDWLTIRSYDLEVVS